MRKKGGTVRHMTQHTSFAGVFWQMTNEFSGRRVHMSPLRISRNSPEGLPFHGICELCVRRIVKIREQPGTEDFSMNFHTRKIQLSARPRSIKFQRRKHVNLLYAFKVMPYSAENQREKPLCRSRSTILD